MLELVLCLILCLAMWLIQFSLGEASQDRLWRHKPWCRRTVLRDLATERDGARFAESPFDEHVFFTHRGHEVVARCFGEYSIEADWVNKRNSGWEIRFGDKCGANLGIWIETGRDAVDPRIVTFTKKATATECSLNDRVVEEFRLLTQSLAEHRDVLSLGGMVLSMERDKLILRCAEFEPSLPVFRELVQAFLNTIDHIHDGGPAAITFVTGKTSHTVHDSSCQVCGCHLADDLVYCSACLTPHHRDCWQYNGGCSTYGCLGDHAQVANTPTATSSDRGNQ